MGKPEMNGGGESDGSVVPKKPTNKGRGGTHPAESVEERDPAKGNPRQQTRDRTQRRQALRSALERVRQAAVRNEEERFTALWHHVYEVDRLREAYLGLERKAAAGVDEVTWEQYGEELEKNLQDLSARLQRGACRAKPVRRVHIPKEDGRQRPIGVPTLEDKIVQRATVEVLNAVYEADFLGFSYGFRPGRSQHNALDALVVGIERKKVNWVLDADIRGFFDAIDHEWLVRFVEHRIADKRVVRHIRKWLNAGVLEGDRWYEQDEGTPQGGSVSPLLANIYLHYAFDLWAQRWRKKEARGDVIIVRYADDFIVGFQHRNDAERFQAELAERLLRFGLELHPDKTRLLRFGRVPDFEDPAFIEIYRDFAFGDLARLVLLDTRQYRDLLRRHHRPRPDGRPLRRRTLRLRGRHARLPSPRARRLIERSRVSSTVQDAHRFRYAGSRAGLSLPAFATVGQGVRTRGHGRRPVTGIRSGRQLAPVRGQVAPGPARKGAYA
jgi:RNA-directed DNA polymerase